MSGIHRRRMHDAAAKRLSPTATQADVEPTKAAEPAANAGADPNTGNAPGAADAPAGAASPPGAANAPGGAGAANAPGGAAAGGPATTTDGGDGGIAGFFSSLFNPDPTQSNSVVPPVTSTKATVPVTSVTTSKSSSSSSTIVSKSTQSVVTPSSTTSTTTTPLSSSAVRQTSTVIESASIDTVVTRITSSATTHTSAHSISAADNAATSTPVSTSTSSMSEGELVGGIAAAIVVAIVAILGAFYFIRRCRSRDADDDDFDPNAFRAQSIALPEDTPSPMVRVPSPSRGSPRPPTMIERKFNNMTPLSQPPMYPGQPMYPNQPMYPGQNMYNQTPYGQPNPYGAYGQTNSYSDFNQGPLPMPSFQPGQVIFAPETPTPRAMTFSPPLALPMHAAASPIAPPQPVAFKYEGDNAVSRRSSNGSQTSLTRKNSNGHNQGNVAANPFEQPEEAHYIDLSRSSVTPFQAAQYVEISRHLGSAPPTPLLKVTEEGENAQAHPDESPFDDESAVQEITIPERSARIQSFAPVLPEVVQRPFSPVIISPGPTMGFGSPSTGPSHLRVSTQPTFDVNEPKITDFDLPPTAAPTVTGFNVNAGPRGPIEKKRPETLYDDEDAYGGM